MKKLLFTLAFCLIGYALIAQDLIKPINGKSFFTEIQSVENGIVKYQIGVSKMTMPTADVVLIEFSEGGVQYFHPEALHEIDPNSIMQPVQQRGHKVYIPFSSKNLAQRSGALKLRELIREGGFWEVVDCKEEAHFILEFEYTEEGLDGGVVKVKDRNGNLLVQTPKVNNSDWNQTQKGEDIAKGQYAKYVHDMGTGELDFDKGHLFLSRRKRGFALRPEIGVGIESDSGHGPLIDSYVTAEYLCNPYFSIGGGGGIIFPADQGRMLFSVYVNPRVYFCDKEWSTFFDVKMGYSIPLIDYSYRESFMVRAMLGMQHKGFDYGIAFGIVGKGVWPLTFTIAYNFRFNKK